MPYQTQVIDFKHSQDFQSFKNKAMAYAFAQANQAVYLTPNGEAYPEGAFKEVLAFQAKEVISATQNPFTLLAEYQAKHTEWLFGYLGYDLKNYIEKLESKHNDRTDFADACFFVPKHRLTFTNQQVEISSSEDIASLLKAIDREAVGSQNPAKKSITIEASMSREEYIKRVKQIRGHIAEGDIYELNFCMEFFAEQVKLEPLAVFRALMRRSPMPFSALFKSDAHFIICASPERFLKKTGDVLISQPIKGTIKRGQNAKEDQIQRQKLATSEKERAENMMIVDLVRNDLARTAHTGSIQVKEMFGIYGFAYLFQMISTVASRLDTTNYTWIDALRLAFPMGSMTGAPKIKSMQLIEQYENHKRGAYSGALGWISPNLDFDFNVLIRSIFYNQETEKLCFKVGSAITYDSDPAAEYEECLLKAEAIYAVLEAELLCIN
ncbi:MAG: aminodeoxychorismate synthase component I [Bernardetiaceae bacterium]|nr:aminodeoxychorismate synthase component I [Bernardetiaceae bacterium]